MVLFVDSDVAIQLASADKNSSAAYHTRRALVTMTMQLDFDAAIRLYPETAITSIAGLQWKHSVKGMLQKPTLRKQRG